MYWYFVYIVKYAVYLRVVLIKVIKYANMSLDEIFELKDKLKSVVKN